MQAIPVSSSTGSFIALVDGRWALQLSDGQPPLNDAADPAFWPLLESDPQTVIALARVPGEPALPFETIIESAIRSASPYWQEATIPWIRALGIEPSSSIGEAASDVVTAHRANQRSRQQLERWLSHKPWR